MPEASATRTKTTRSGRYIAALRYQRGLSPEQMGRLVGIGGATIRDIECGKAKRPHLETQQRIADFFGIDKATIWRG